ncbi:MAG: AraC family transcriptional regulator [Elstera sp.]
MMLSPFDDALRDLRLSGSILLAETYYPGLAVDIPSEAALRARLAVPSQQRLFLFHLVCEGRLTITLPRRDPLTHPAGNLALCTDEQPHELSFGPVTRRTNLPEILAGGFSDSEAVGASPTRLICGVLLTVGVSINPLLRALPPVMQVPVEGPAIDPVLAASVELLKLDRARASQDQDFTATRLAEILCAEALRAYRPSEQGWFRGVTDPRLSVALAQFHQAPAAEWSVARLAEIACLSPSRFAARFKNLMGESVMAYVTRWRMTLACRLLRETNAPVSAVAQQIGYEAVPAFTRSFKGMLGLSPGAWRQNQRAS